MAYHETKPENASISKAQEAVKHYRQLAKEKRQTQTFDSFKSQCRAGSKPYFLTLNLKEKYARYPSDSLYYGDLPHYNNSLNGKYEYTIIHKVFEGLLAIKEKHISSDTVEITLKTVDGSSINEAIIDKAEAYYSNLPHVKWLKTFSEASIDSGNEAVTLIGEPQEASDDTLIELAYVINQLTDMGLDVAYLLLKSATNTNSWPLELATNYKGITLYIHKDTNYLHPQVEIIKNELQGDQKEPFFTESSTFAALVMGFESAGLTLSDRLMSALLEDTNSRGYQTRYGNGYADFTRKITEQLDVSVVGITATLFVGETPESATQKVKNLPNLSTESPAGLVFYLLKQLYADRSNTQDTFTLMSIKSVKDGSCKDAETYYTSARYIQEYSGKQKLFYTEYFVEKRDHGEKTAINIKPVTVGGVTFPPGFLFKVDDFGRPSAARPLRPTMASFPAAQAQDAFGWQYKEMENNNKKIDVATELENLL